MFRLQNICKRLVSSRLARNFSTERKYNDFGELKSEKIDTKYYSIHRTYNDFGELKSEKIIDKSENVYETNSQRVSNARLSDARTQESLSGASSTLPEFINLAVTICVNIWKSDPELRKNITNYIYRKIDGFTFNIKSSNREIPTIEKFTENHDREILNIPQNEKLTQQSLHSYYVKKLKICHPDVSKSNNSHNETSKIIESYNKLKTTIK
jgi:hypothetical protein